MKAEREETTSDFTFKTSELRSADLELGAKTKFNIVSLCVKAGAFSKIFI